MEGLKDFEVEEDLGAEEVRLVQESVFKTKFAAVSQCNHDFGEV